MVGSGEARTDALGDQAPWSVGTAEAVSAATDGAQVTWRALNKGRHPLPRNVRKLNALLASTVDASTGDEVRLPGSGPMFILPPDKQETKGAKAGKPSKAELVALLQREQGSVARAAERLGLPRTAVHRLMESYGIKKNGKTGGVNATQVPAPARSDVAVANCWFHACARACGAARRRQMSRAEMAVALRQALA